MDMSASQADAAAKPEWPTPTNAILIAGFSLIVILLAAAAVFYNKRVTATAIVDRSQFVDQALSELTATLQNAESSQRGYIITRQEKYLAHYNEALSEIPVQLNELDSLAANAADQPERLNSLAELRPVIDAKLEELAETIALVRDRDAATAINVIRSGQGETLMVDIRARLQDLQMAEGALLQSRQETVDDIDDMLNIVLGLTGLVVLALGAVVALSTNAYIRRVKSTSSSLKLEIARREQSELALRQAQKLEAIGQLTGGIAHDFNNLLTIIIGNLDTLQRRLTAEGPIDPDIIARPVASALQGAKSAAQLTHRLLAFSRQQALEPTPLDLNRLVSNTSELLKRAVGEAHSIETVLGSGLWPTFADPSQVENAIVNLVVNARDAMPGGGKITIETANAHLDDAYARQFSELEAGQYVLLSVTDAGFGMNEQTLHRVFEPFFTTKERGKGTGLGLAMVHGFVKQSGGHVRVYSEVGVGTTVKIYLPRHAEEHALQTTPPPRIDEPAPHARAAETILLVEDNKGVLEYAVSVLKQLGYNVLVAEDAATALNYAESGASFDLLFTDVVMPGAMNGRQLADRLTERRPDLPVLFTTGYTRNAIIHHGRLDPNLHLLSKPYTQDQLARKLRSLLDARKD